MMKSNIATSASENKIINFPVYIEAMKDLLKPPVSNALIHSGLQLKVMLVKGPNQRNDYHMNLGEELFYQYKGAIDVNIKDPARNIDQSVSIQEGQMFLLSSTLPHSPQRYDDTWGIVFERTRNVDEVDGLRWYTPSGQVLYEKYFHCTDLGTQVKDAITEYHQSNQCKTSIPMEGKDMDIVQQQYQDSYHNRRSDHPIHTPFHIDDAFDKCSNDTAIRIIASEFDVVSLKGMIADNSHFHPDNEVFFWQREGSASITLYNTATIYADSIQVVNLAKDDMILIPYTERIISIDASSHSKLLAVQNKAANITDTQ